MWSICLLLFLCQEPAQGQNLGLTPEQKAFFDKLFRDGLFDPTGATWCKIATTDPLRHRHDPTISFGWVKEGKLYHVNGVAIKLSEHQQATPTDILEHVKDCHKSPDERYRDYGRWGMAILRGNIVNPPDLAMAAWCYRIGKEVEATQLLSHLLAQPQTVIRKDNERRTIRGRLSTLDSLLLGYRFDMECICYHELSRHFWLHEDRIALAHAEVMEKHFAKCISALPDCQGAGDRYSAPYQGRDSGHPDSLSTACRVRYLAQAEADRLFDQGIAGGSTLRPDIIGWQLPCTSFDNAR